MREARYEVYRVRPGWQYRVYFGEETDQAGNPRKGTAGKIVGGWAESRPAALQLVDDVIQAYAEVDK